VSSIILPPSQFCLACSRELPSAALECPQCHALVHAEELERISSRARELENQNQPREAREQWLAVLSLLPAESSQAKWVRDHMRRLSPVASPATHPVSRNKWANKLGPLAPVAIALSKAKVLLSLLKLSFLVSLAAFIGVYWTLYGMKFGIGFATLILLHEMGHFLDIKRRGLPAEMPVFLPGLGAYVRWQALGVSQETKAAVSLAGPLAGFLAAAACALIWWETRSGIWAALARTSAWLNALNLIPVWVLDGGEAATALDRQERLWLLTSCLALWLLLGQSVFFLVAAGAGYRLFTKDLPPHPSRATTAYFMGVLTALGLVMWLLPGQISLGTR
jgi:Zn-dependent protease